MRVGIFDIETTDLSANYGIILCATVKELGKKKKLVTFRGDDYPTWAEERSSDRFICAYLAEELQKYNILVGHNAKDFDIKFLNTRMVINGLAPIPKKMLVDPCLIARNKLRMNSNRLDQLISSFGLDNLKTPINSTVWLKASLDGDPAAMDFIADHCERDVQMLEQVFLRLSPFVERIDGYGSAA